MFNRCTIYWYRLNDAAKVPTKRDEDAGFDIYTTETDIRIPAHSQHLFATGIAAAISKGWWLKVEDRGSTGSKGLHYHCGVIDTGYRDEIFICIKNDNPYDVIFTDKENPGMHTATVQGTLNEEGILTVNDRPVFEEYLVYPTSKAIAQIVPMKKPKVKSKEASISKWAKLCHTERGTGKLGSSGK